MFDNKEKLIAEAIEMNETLEVAFYRIFMESGTFNVDEFIAFSDIISRVFLECASCVYEKETLKLEDFEFEFLDLINNELMGTDILGEELNGYDLFDKVKAIIKMVKTALSITAFMEQDKAFNKYRK